MHMPIKEQYDVAIIGGGLAGLAAAIQLRKAGYSVILFEKEKYPFHKVCGEYISLESWDFLEQLGLPLKNMNLPQIDSLILTAPNGKSFTTKLPLGGFGISRYLLDDSLSKIAKTIGVELLEETKVTEVIFNDDFNINFDSKNVELKTIKAKVCCSAYGKRSNLDVKWKRSFTNQKQNSLNNYVGVKYHVKTEWPENVIGLHNFKNGYCGISKIEEDRYCLCYMTTAESLKNSGNIIKEMEADVLFANPHLKNIFYSAKIIENFPVTISQISFAQKSQVENHMLMLGDSAGMITPLCGNGMSIALHTSKISSQLIQSFLQGVISRSEMEDSYAREWKQNFASRLKIGRMLQKFFGSLFLSNLFVQIFKNFSFLAKPVIKMTHGKSF